jgi:hypothetical protein
MIKEDRRTLASLGLIFVVGFATIAILVAVSLAVG